MEYSRPLHMNQFLACVEPVDIAICCAVYFEKTTICVSDMCCLSNYVKSLRSSNHSHVEWCDLQMFSNNLCGLVAFCMLQPCCSWDLCFVESGVVVMGSWSWPCIPQNSYCGIVFHFDWGITFDPHGYHVLKLAMHDCVSVSDTRETEVAHNRGNYAWFSNTMP